MSTPEFERLSILLVEPDEDLRTLFTIWLSKVGHRVTSAQGERGARSAASAERFDVLVTELWFAGKPDGLVLAHQLRASDSELHVIVISGSVEPGVDLSGMVHLQKPFARPAMLTAVSVRKKRLNHSHRVFPPPRGLC